MSQLHINLINLSNPHVSDSYTYNNNTLIVDLHQYLTKKSDQEKVYFYFTENQLFKGNLNCFLYQHIRASSIYYNFEVSKTQQQSSSMSDFQENQKQLTNSGIQHSTTSQSIQGSSSQSQSGTLYNRDESTVKNNGDYQKNQDQLVQQLQSKIKELTDVLKEKEVEMSMTLQGNKIQLTDLQDQNSKNMKIIQNLNQQNFELKDQLAQLQMNAQLQEKEMQNLKTQIEELKIENGTQNFRAHNKIQINDVSDQKYQGQEENQQELINFQPKKHEIALLSFNDSAEMYKNKCGHMIEKNKLESLLIQAVKNNQIVKCETCNSNFSATICQDIGMIGENYLKIKSTLELSQMYNNYKPLQKSHLSVVSCENPSCNFFCFYQTANHYDDSDYSYCPNCLIRSVNNPKEVPNIITF